jgi:TRAP-type C4-dicarboxylate transport system permease small subunit
MQTIIAFLKMIDRLLPVISKVCIFLCGIALVTLLVIFGWLVFGRYVLNVTPTWVEQLALLLVVYITFLGAAAGIHEETHLGVSFIRESFPDWLRKPLRIIADLILAAFGLIMLFACIELVQFGWSTNLAMLNIPEGIRTMAAAICGGFIFIFASAHALSRIYRYYFVTFVAEDQGAN